MREVPGSIPRSSTFAPSWSQLRYLKHQKSVTTVVNWRPRNDRFFKNSTTLKERHHSKEMVLLNCKTVQPIHDNIRYTDLKAPMGFEPMTSCLLDRCSNHLSYGAKRRLSARKCSRDTGAATTSWKVCHAKSWRVQHFTVWTVEKTAQEIRMSTRREESSGKPSAWNISSLWLLQA